MKKQHLPEKLCATCGRPFKWRKKWQRVWDDVKFCSDRCRMKKSIDHCGIASIDTALASGTAVAEAILEDLR